jgi:beta-galactosidase
VSVWEREAPAGPGISGLWRPIPRAEEGGGLLALILGAGNIVFTLKQDGNRLTGSVEGTGGGFFGGNDVPTPITEGKVDGPNISFKAGNGTYSGTLNGDQIELERRIDFGFRLPNPPAEPAGTRPAIGPPPDGSDPSIGAFRFRGPAPLVLHRVQR